MKNKDEIERKLKPFRFGMMVKKTKEEKIYEYGVRRALQWVLNGKSVLLEKIEETDLEDLKEIEDSREGGE